MKRLVFIFLFFSIHSGFAQSNYFLGDYTYCSLPDPESRRLYKLGLECIQRNLYIDQANKIFRDLIKKDSTFCDAYFFTGLTYRLKNKFEEAVTYYYIADSLSKNENIIFNQNLGTTSSYIGLFELSEESFNDIVKYFPDSPEGYYGLAANSVFIGDFEKGLENVNIALSKYKSNKLEVGKEVYLTKAMLLTNLERFEESLRYYNQIKGELSRNDTYKIFHAYSLKKVGKQKNDKDLIKKANKLYNKIKDKSILSSEMRLEFQG